MIANMTKMLHVFELFISDSTTNDVEKKVWIASSTKDCKNRLKPTQEIIRIKKVDDKYAISLDKLRDALSKAGYDDTEKSLIVSIVRDGLPHK